MMKTTTNRRCKASPKDEQKNGMRFIYFFPMVIVLFFWGLAIGNIRKYIYNTSGFVTQTTNIFEAILYVFSSVIYAYLIVGIFKPAKMPLPIVIGMVSAFVIFSIITFFVFPIPWEM